MLRFYTFGYFRTDITVLRLYRKIIIASDL